MAVSGVEAIFGTLFRNTFGQSIMLGFVGLIFIVALGIALKLGLEGFLLLLLASTYLMIEFGYLPLSVGVIFFIICGTIIFLAFMSVIKR